MTNEHIEKIKKIININKISKEVPILSLIYNKKNQDIFYCKKNTRERKKIICGHAEINCINKVFKKFKSKNLNDWEIISTLIPCEMCFFAIKQANIKKVYYYLNNEKNKTLNFDNEKILEKLTDEIYLKVYKKKLSDFFINIRGKK